MKEHIQKVYDKELAFSCEKCPNPLTVGELEEDFENIFECNFIDGINLGNIEMPKKGLSVSIFDEAKVENVLVKGAEAVDRTAISTPKMRQLLKTLIDSLFDKHILKETLSKWQKVKQQDAISQLLASYDKLDYQILKSFLKNETRISSSFGLMKKLKSAFPILIKIILAIMNEEGIAYNLPDNVTYIFQETVNS